MKKIKGVSKLLDKKEMGSLLVFYTVGQKSKVQT